MGTWEWEKGQGEKMKDKRYEETTNNAMGILYIVAKDLAMEKRWEEGIGNVGVVYRKGK